MISVPARRLHDPAAEALQPLLRAGEVLDLGDLAIADDHVGLAGEDRRHQLGNVGAAVLVVGVGVDDHVGAELQTGVEPGLEAGGEALVVGQPDDVLDARARGRPRPCDRSSRRRSPAARRCRSRRSGAGGRRSSPAASLPRSGRGSGRSASRARGQGIYGVGAPVLSRRPSPMCSDTALRRPALWGTPATTPPARGTSQTPRSGAVR